MKSFSAFTRLLIQLAIGVPMFMQSLIAQGTLAVDLGDDTLFVCSDDVLTLTPAVSGGTSPYFYLWSDSSQQADLSWIPGAGDQVEVWIEVRDGQGQVARDTQLVIAYGNCIWPGDMNGDGLANHVDLLEWGRAVGAMGPIRPMAHTNWIGQPSPDWGSILPGGHDFAYADTDGDGLIHENDLQAVDKNYTHVFAQAGSQGSGPLLQLSFDEDSSLVLGDTVRIPVYLGDATMQVDSLYGIAMTIGYDNTVINSGSIEVDFDSSWLGNMKVDMEAITRDFHQVGQLDIAITRTDLQERTGTGRLFDLIVTIDNVAGKTNSAFILNIDLLDVRLLKGNGQQQFVTTRSLSLEVFPEPISRGPEPPRSGVRVYPNPVSSLLIISPGKEMIEEVELIDLSGREVIRKKGLWETTFTWTLSDLERGIYFLKMKTTEGNRIMRKIQLID